MRFVFQVLRGIKLMRFCAHENIAAVRDVLPPHNWDKFEDIYIVSDLMDTDLHQVVLIYPLLPLLDAMSPMPPSLLSTHATLLYCFSW